MNDVDTSKQSPTILSLCTGIRGLERGIERAMGVPCNVAAYAEIEAFIIENLLAGMEAGVLAPAPIWTDIKTFPWSEFRGKIHGIIGGYPCQPFSVAGNQLGKEDPRHLWPYIKEGIRAIRPLWCFFENVPGHLNIGYEAVRRELQELDYRVEEGIFSAEEVGAPHKRQRLFILAVANSESSRDRGELSGLAFKNAKQQAQKKSRENKCSEFVHANTKVGNANRSSAECTNEKDRGEPRKRQIRSQGIWPTRPGEDQYGWEEPRRSKSGLGITINGYNFREDLLRAAGNGVVEQTAELAWITLWQKHDKNL